VEKGKVWVFERLKRSQLVLKSALNVNLFQDFGLVLNVITPMFNAKDAELSLNCMKCMPLVKRVKPLGNPDFLENNLYF